jgi:2-methylcitrate dehydratase PrpD
VSTTNAAGLSATLARHVANVRYEDLPPATVAATKRALTDGIGVMLAASGLSPDVTPFVTTALQMGGPPRASILGDWRRVGAAAAAFANGAMAHALDFEDAFDAAPTHPNASLLPAALATAQDRGSISGRELITAVAVGCDLACRLALSVGDAMERTPWYPPPILGAFGAAAAAAKLRRLNASQVLDAFSLMLCQTACPGEIKWSEHSVIRAVREAFPAQGAVVAALLAEQGVRGFETPLEGRGGFYRLFANDQYDAHQALDGLGERWYIDELSFKPWPCCRGTHPYVEAAQTLRANHDFAWTDIKRVRAFIGPVQRMLSEPIERKRQPATSIDAKFSIPFSVAAAFVHADVTLESFLPEQLAGRDVLTLARRVEPELRPDVTTPSSGALAVELNDGRQLECRIDQPLGHPDRPMSDLRFAAKFVDCARRAAKPMKKVEAEALYATLMALDDKPDVEAALGFPKDFHTEHTENTEFG